jgi:hypothetical protein
MIATGRQIASVQAVFAAELRARGDSNPAIGLGISVAGWANL